MKTLGGLRHARADSPNTGWKNASFQGFADYMQTPEFSAAVQQLIEAAIEKPAAIMCAEAVPWRCHRSLIADALTVRGITVQHILSRTSARVHTVTPMARVEGTRITYPRQPDAFVIEEGKRQSAAAKAMADKQAIGTKTSKQAVTDCSSTQSS